MATPYFLPFDIINIILDYDGRIKYNHNQHIFVNIIHKHDFRYNIIMPIVSKKNKIITKNVCIYDKSKSKSSFYFEFNFDIDNRIGMCYDYNFTYPNEFEICYYDMRNKWEQIRTYL